MTNLAAAVERLEAHVIAVGGMGMATQHTFDIADLLKERETILAELGSGAGVPEGWALVPIEPNWDMRNEGREFLIDGLEKEPEKLAYFLWKTMVAASPIELEKRDAAIENAQASEGK